jgi:hypothetical protein
MYINAASMSKPWEAREPATELRIEFDHWIHWGIVHYKWGTNHE